MKRKWMFAAALAGCMILTGCGNSEKTKTTEATGAETSETEETAAVDETEEETATEETAEEAEEAVEETEETTIEAEEAVEETTAEAVTEEATAKEENTEVQSTDTDDAATLADVNVSGWHIVVEDLRLNSSLENVSVELGYTGVETSSYEKEASEGKQFCLIKLLIEKDGSKEQIDWKNLILTDEDGTEYTRLEDEFIIELGMMRMPGTSLNFGSNEGWIAFEVSETSETFTLSYAFEEETFSCDLEG